MDEAGFVAEGTTMNLGVITHDGEVVIPPFEQSLAGCTARRLMAVIAEVPVPPLTPCCTSKVCVCPWHALCWRRCDEKNIHISPSFA